jgi:hypothetical protein
VTRKWVFTLLATLAECCTPVPSPAAISPGQVYIELVDGGCLLPDEAGVTYVSQEHALPDQPAWMVCLFDGGNVTSCAVPCQ